MTATLRAGLFAAFTALVLAAAAPGVRAQACDDCFDPAGTLAPPNATCQYQPGTVSAACLGNFWTVDLVAGETYVFTTCDTRCPLADAAFDSFITLWDGSCFEIGWNDDACGSGRSELVVTPWATGPHVVSVESFGGAGDYILGYYKQCRSGDCWNANGTLAPPTTACQSVTDVNCGPTNAYSVTLTQGQTYTFSLCPATCGGSAPFNSRVELVDPSGFTVANSSSACGDDGMVVYTTDATTGGGTYCVRVSAESGAGTFTLGYSVACQPPSALVVSPLVGGATTDQCSRSERFTATVAGTGSFTWSWTITPPAGGSAVPATGTETTTGGSSRLSSVLSGVGRYQVTVRATNDCGTVVQSFSYDLQDRLAPDLQLAAVETSCGAPIAPIAPPPVDRIRSAGVGQPPAGDGAFARLQRVAADPGRLAADRDAKQARSLARARGLDAGRGPVLAPRPQPAPLPQPQALGCAAPCDFGVVSAEHPYYDVYLSCDDGSFTARTGAQHSVTTTSGWPQNVIFGGAGGGPGTSDAAWYFHGLDLMWQNPFPGAACVFDPPDTPAEPNSIGIEMEWEVEPAPGLHVVLREEIVAFGTTEQNSGIRLTLGATNLGTSTRSARMGVRWQIDYQNGGDDGPFFATVTCDPPTVQDVLEVEHELAPAEIRDFYRIQNNTGDPIFANYTNTTAIAGFPDTGTPDRLVFGYWPSMVGGAWDRFTNEGDASVDWDSAVHYWFGHDDANAIEIAPSEDFTRSVVIFTSNDGADCAGFVPGVGSNADVTACVGTCVELTALAQDACGASSVALVSSSPGAPPCTGTPCTIELSGVGTHVYTWSAVDLAGNETTATTTVNVVDGGDCAGCSTSVVAPPGDRVICLGAEAQLDGSGVSVVGCTGGVLHEWREGARVVGTGPILRVTPTATTTYTLTVSCLGDATCTVVETVTVVVERPPLMPTPQAADLAPCAGAVRVSWPAALFPSGSGSYAVYRSEVGCADAVLAAPLVTGLRALSWVDVTTEAGRTYTYVVQAEDDRAAAACVPVGPGGGAVARSCAAPVTDVGGDGVPAGVDDTLRVSHVGAAVTVHWSGARALLAGEHFHLLEADLQATAPFVNALAEGSTSRSHADPDRTTRLKFYDLRVANPCEQISADEFPAGWDNGRRR